MKLFPNKNFNKNIEDVLEKKVFSADTKSLFLSLIYKLDTAYNDYKKVKRCVKSKSEFFEEMAEVIDDYCDNIKTVKMDSKGAEILAKHKVLAATNERERSILSYPTEMALLYAISDIEPKYFYMEDDFVFKKQLQNVLVSGYITNNTEILTTFNGWSWDVNSNKNIKYLNNLIYQNLLFMVGDKFLTQWRKSSSAKRDFIGELRKYVKDVTGSERYYYKLLHVLFLASKGKEKKNIELVLKEKSKELKQMNDKTKFIENATKKKEKYKKLLLKIDKLEKDRELLKKELEKTNQKLDKDKRIATPEIYLNMLRKDKIACTKYIEKIDELLKPSNYSKKKKELEQYALIYMSQASISKVVIDLQKEFLIFLNKKLEKMILRDEIVDFIYELRYIKYIPLSQGQFISNINDLNNAIDKILKKAITIASKNGILKIISMDINLNFEILKYAIDTKIIDLEEVRLLIKKSEDGIIIQVYDKEILEKQGGKKIEKAKGLLEVKYEKMLKIFN